MPVNEWSDLVEGGPIYVPLLKRLLPGQDVEFLANTFVDILRRHLIMIPYLKGLIGPLDVACSECGHPRQPSKLLYPITEKDYASDELIADQWKLFRYSLGRAAVFTVFGYSAPSSDAEAMDAIKAAWGTPEQRQFEQFEIIDIREEEEVLRSWSGLIHSHHYDVVGNYFDSWLAKHPGRSVDMYVAQELMAQFIGDDPAPRDVTLEELWAWFARLKEEN